MKSLSLKVSDTANILFNKNVKMFNRINNANVITSMKLTRHSIIKVKNRTNKLSTKTNKSFESTDEEIAVLNFTDGILEPTSRYRWPSGKKSDISLRNILTTSKKNILNIDQPTIDDINSASLVCTSKELRLFQNLGIKTFLFKDNLANKENIVEIAYTLEISTQTVFLDYIKNNIKKLKGSINFIKRYLNGIRIGKAYNYQSEHYNEKFLRETFSSIGIKYPFVGSNVQSDKATMGQSIFGTASKNIYNSKLLLSNSVSTSIYDQTLLMLLPLKTSNPEQVSKILNDFEVTLGELERLYLKKKGPSNSRGKSLVSSIKKAQNTLIVKTKDNYEFDDDELGYNIFSNRNSMPEFTISQMKQRVKSETKRYCRPLDKPGSLPGLKKTEKSKFTNKNSTLGFLTPIGLRDGKNVIDTSRGIFSLSPEEVSVFRMKKSIKSSRKRKNKYTKSVAQNKVGSSAASSFNLSIGKPIKSALTLKRQGEVNPYIDAREFFGDSTTFIVNQQFIKSLGFKKRFKKLNKTNQKVLSRLVPRAFLTQKSKIKSTKEISIKSGESRITKAIFKGSVDIEKIPPQIRSLALQPPPKPSEIDPIKNFKSAGIIEETQMNAFSVRALIGFDRDETGFFNMNSPIYRTLDLNILESDRPLLVFADNYEVPEIGILKDKVPATIYNRMIYIKGRRRDAS